MTQKMAEEMEQTITITLTPGPVGTHPSVHVDVGGLSHAELVTALTSLLCDLRDPCVKRRYQDASAVVTQKVADQHALLPRWREIADELAEELGAFLDLDDAQHPGCVLREAAEAALRRYEEARDQ